MKKIKFLGIILAMILVFPNIIYAKTPEAIGSYQKVYVDNTETKLKGYAIDGYNYIRIRDFLATMRDFNENIGVDWDSNGIILDKNKSYDDYKNYEINIVTGEKKSPKKQEVQIKLSENGETKVYKKVVYNIDNYNYFRLRDLGEILGLIVDYYESDNSARVYTKSQFIFDGKENTALEEINNFINEVVAPKSEYSHKVVLGNERLIKEFSNLIDGKNIGLITNQTGVDSEGARTVDKLYNYKKTNLKAIYSPEHGLDGKHKAGAYVESYQDTKLNLPVYSLYGKTREPSKDMLKGVDVLIFDIQDIGSRTYTYVSTMNYAMRAAKKYGIKMIILDRPNPLGGEIVSGFDIDNKYLSFVGVDNMPMAHGMTIGELAKYYNRKIGADIEVIPMIGWERKMVWQDTELPFSQTSPNIANLESAFNYMATGIGDGTGLGQAEKFKWIGSSKLDSKTYADIMNSYNLPGVKFIPKTKGKKGGVNLEILDYHTFNPQKTGVYLLATANNLGGINIPSGSDGKIPMFEKIHGGDKMGDALRKNLSPYEIEKEYMKDVEKFKEIRKPYLIYK